MGGKRESQHNEVVILEQEGRFAINKERGARRVSQAEAEAERGRLRQRECSVSVSVSALVF